MTTMKIDLEDDAVEFARLDVLDRLGILEASLKTADPQLPVHLGAIRKSLGTYEELVHLLDDDKIKVLFDALIRHSRVELVKEGATKRSSKALAKTTLDDI